MLSSTVALVRRMPRRPWLQLGIFWSLAGLFGLLELHEHAFYPFNTAHYDSLSLPRYEVVQEAVPVATVSDNLSGLAWDGDRKKLWGVVNNPEVLLLLERDGTLIARYPLHGFTDVEAIAYLGDDLLVLVEERSRELVIVPIPEPGENVQRDRYTSLALGFFEGIGDNAGFEGVGYDAEGDRLFLVKERVPRRLYEIQGLKASLQGQFGLRVIDRQSWLDDAFTQTKDLSSVEFDARNGHLLLVSEESNMILELDTTGELVSQRSFANGFASLKKNLLMHAEGISLDEEGNLYLVSEPNLFYSFRQRHP